MVTNFGLYAVHRSRHVAFDARTAGAARGVVGVRRDRLADSGVAARAEGIRGRPELRIFFDLHLMDGAVARDASGSAFQETLALPQSVSVVRETARSAIGPIGGIFIARLI